MTVRILGADELQHSQSYLAILCDSRDVYGVDLQGHSVEDSLKFLAQHMLENRDTYLEQILGFITVDPIEVSGPEDSTVRLFEIQFKPLLGLVDSVVQAFEDAEPASIAVCDHFMKLVLVQREDGVPLCQLPGSPDELFSQFLEITRASNMHRILQMPFAEPIDQGEHAAVLNALTSIPHLLFELYAAGVDVADWFTYMSDDAALGWINWATKPIGELDKETASFRELNDAICETLNLEFEQYMQDSPAEWSVATKYYRALYMATLSTGQPDYVVSLVRAQWATWLAPDSVVPEDREWLQNRKLMELHDDSIGPKDVIRLCEIASYYE